MTGTPDEGGRTPSRFVNSGTLIFLALALATGAATFYLRGADGVERALAQSVWLVVIVMPQLAAGLLIGGLVHQLVPQQQVTRFLGRQSGLSGLFIAAAIGTITPGGPFTSFPLVYALFLAGADIGALVAYVGAWSLIGINRLLVWELPFLGFELTTMRFLASLPLPIIAGLIARRLAQLPIFAVKRD